MFSICHSCIACVSYFKALANVVGFLAASKPAHVGCRFRLLLWGQLATLWQGQMSRHRSCWIVMHCLISPHFLHTRKRRYARYKKINHKENVFRESESTVTLSKMLRYLAWSWYLWIWYFIYIYIVRACVRARACSHIYLFIYLLNWGEENDLKCAVNLKVSSRNKAALCSLSHDVRLPHVIPSFVLRIKVIQIPNHKHTTEPLPIYVDVIILDSF